MNVLIVGTQNSDIPPVVNSLIVIKPDVLINENNLNEYCLKAYLMINGEESCCIGLVGSEFHPFRQLYEFKLGQIIKDYSNSNNLQERRVSAERDGVVVCRIVN